jgi:hypothetical protein
MRSESDIARDIDVCSEARARIRFADAPSTDELYEAARLTDHLDALFEERRLVRSGAVLGKLNKSQAVMGSGNERDPTSDLDFRTRRVVAA